MKLKKNLNLALQSIRIEIMSSMIDPVSFFIFSIGTITRIFVTIIFFKAIYLHVNFLGGWSINEVYVLLGTYYLIEAIGSAFYDRGYYMLPYLVENGNLDLYLVKPVNLKLFFIYHRTSIIYILPQALAALGLILYGSINNFIIINLPIYLLFFCFAIIIHFCLTLIIYTVNFFYIVPQSNYLLGEILNLGQYPIAIYKGLVKITLSIIIPIAFIYSIPTRALFGNISIKEFFVALIIVFVLYFISNTFWKYGLNKYESAQG